MRATKYKVILLGFALGEKFIFACRQANRQPVVFGTDLLSTSSMCFVCFVFVFSRWGATCTLFTIGTLVDTGQHKRNRSLLTLFILRPSKDLYPLYSASLKGPIHNNSRARKEKGQSTFSTVSIAYTNSHRLASCGTMQGYN